MELVNDEANILTSFAYGENSILRIFMRGNRKKATTYFAGSANLKACLMMAGPNAVQEAKKLGLMSVGYDAVYEKYSDRFLTADMSHEIRTLINAVLSMNEMILRESNEPNVMEYSGKSLHTEKYLTGCGCGGLWKILPDCWNVT